MNGHQFTSVDPTKERFVVPTKHGDKRCVNCGRWTSFCLSDEEANERLGLCLAQPSDLLQATRADLWERCAFYTRHGCSFPVDGDRMFMEGDQ